MRQWVVVWLALALVCLSSACIGDSDTGHGTAALNPRDASAPPPPPPLDGDGTPASPFLIHDCAELARVSEDLGAHYRLAADVDCSGVPFSPLGTASQAFRGSLDGGGHLIVGVTIDAPSANRVGLFARTQGAEISRVGLVDVDVRGENQVGAFAGLAEETSLREVFAQGTVSGKHHVGALLGVTDGATIADSYAHVHVALRNDRGGYLFGMLDESSIATSYAVGALDGRDPPALTDQPNPSAIVASFFDCTVAGECPSRDPAALETADIQSEAFLAARGWNFASVWSTRGAGTYACLRWEPGCGVACSADDATCDGTDDDCDGALDEDFAPIPSACGTGNCAATGFIR